MYSSSELREGARKLLLIVWLIAAFGGLLAAFGGASIYIWSQPGLIAASDPEDPLFKTLMDGVGLGFVGLGLYVFARSIEAITRVLSLPSWKPRPGWENEPYVAPPTSRNEPRA